jgi:phage terminase large subunit-like protein
MAPSLIEQVVRKAGADILLSALSLQERHDLLYDWASWARPEQLPPPGDWLTWLILAGRGWGKSRGGAEWVRHRVEKEGARRIGLVGRTPADVRDTMVEGESGILACCPETNRPRYEASKRRLTWPNGAMALTFTSYEPDQLRGPQHDTIWWDELAAYQYLRETWDNGQLTLRLGPNPRQIITTTPRPVSVLKEIAAAPSTHITRGSTYDNLANLAPLFRQQILAKYEHTTRGRQEIMGELLDDLPGALWHRNLILHRESIELRRICVAVDPAITSDETADETGIVIAAVDVKDMGVVLGDYSLRGSPDIWGRKVVSAYHHFKANFVVAEANNGGEMIQHVIRTVDPTVPVKLVHATVGKHTRAEPVAALYEQGKMYHVRIFPELEDQMCTWLPDDPKSPDRMDALVWAFSELMLGAKAWMLV